LDVGDDAYGPYWPGDDVVDWFGVSVYWKGASYPYVRNDAVASNIVFDQLNQVLGGGQSTYQFAASRNLPIAFPEYGGSYSPAYPGASNLDTKQGMWRQTFSPEAKSRMPSVKLANWFDYYKFEDDSWRDFTVTNETSIGVLGPALKADFDSYPGVLYRSQMALDPSNPGCGCFGYKADGSALTSGLVDQAALTTRVAAVEPTATVSATATPKSGAVKLGAGMNKGGLLEKVLYAGLGVLGGLVWLVGM
jgi:beta-mannanase